MDPQSGRGSAEPMVHSLIAFREAENTSIRFDSRLSELMNVTHSGLLRGEYESPYKVKSIVDGCDHSKFIEADNQAAPSAGLKNEAEHLPSPTCSPEIGTENQALGM